MVDRASNQDDEFYRNLSRRCSGLKDVPIVSLRLELLINEINPMVIPESDTMADGSGLSNARSNETKPEMLPAHAKTSHQDTSTVGANNRWVLDIIQNLKPTILEQSYLERSLLTSDEPSLPHTKQARQQTTYAPELSTPEPSIVSPNNLDQDDCNSSSDEEDLMSFESGSDRTETNLVQIIKKPSLTDRAHVNEMRDLFVEYLQIQASIAAPTPRPDTGMPLNLVIPTVSEEFLATDEERILSKIASPEKSTEADKVATLIQDEADLAVVTFKSFLHSIQEQNDAMYYEEMQLMLKKHRHLAKTCYDSAVALFGEGLASFVLKEYEESFEKFREAELILQDCVCFDKSISNDLSLCLMYMGDVEISQGHYKSALEYYERAIASHLHHSPPSQLEEIFKLERTTLSAMLSKHALSLCNNDCVVDSEERYKQAVSYPDTTPSDIIMAHTGLGNLLHSLGSNEKAAPEYLAAIDIAEKEKDYLSLAWAHGNLGNTYLSLGKREKGLSHLQTSLDLTLEHDFDPSSISRALNNLGTAYQSLNELDKTEIYFDQALSQAIYANDVVAQARAYGNIGNVYMLLKDFLKAIPHYTEVLRLSRDRSTVYVAYHNRGCALFELAEKKKGEQYQFTKRGEFQFIAIGPDTGDMDYKHQPDEELDGHTTELYQQALKDLRKVIKNVESTLSHSSSSTIGLDLYLSLFHINAKTFQRAQDCAFNLRDHYLSLTIAEQVRARTLGELLLKRKSHQLPTTFSTPLNIDAIKLAVELLPDPYTPVVVLSYTGTRLLVWVLVFDGKTVSVNSFEQEPDEELFGKQLDMYLRYELADDLTGNIDLYGEEEESGEKTKKLVKKEKGAKRSGPARKRKILSDLYKMIAKPLEAILKAVIPEPILHSRGPHKLILIPDNSTKMIRFNALLNEEGGVYFGDKHTLQFFPSLLCLSVMSQAPPTVIRINGNTTGGVLIVGDPSIPAFKFEGEDWTPGPLPHAKKEAQCVGHHMRTPPLLGGEPTKVLSKLSQAKLIYLATHGSATYGFVLLTGHCYDRQTTFTSSLRYHEDEKKLLLYASEIESLRLQSCLVILSSCDSGRGKFKGDEIQGMSCSFLLAGAAAVMTSLWKVPDQSASYFMQYFYCYLHDGHTSSGDVLIIGDPSTPAFKFEGEDWTPGPLPHAKAFISLNLKIEELQVINI
ncbi:PREDICTED: tetratricopeptide repeat protein 28-like [Amphimedon queenslandica]|uniref:CHAT domain-containing protein n=1 Tax=Amphimedon queenslandica TaxID=400682 RepID=A0AAN0J7R2_AMPQE|nr:PREDICTED: tetratricopeptide repeat protein 28-like [Amphimedon queenslandica]|eukprot:XP_019853064.1 PREDICTED: tetratricopeptide repeat protein 28-like [Amphimedon queenslandica]